MPGGSKSFGEHPIHPWLGILPVLAPGSQQLHEVIIPVMQMRKPIQRASRFTIAQPVTVGGGIMRENG